MWCVFWLAQVVLGAAALARSDQGKVARLAAAVAAAGAAVRSDATLPSTVLAAPLDEAWRQGLAAAASLDALAQPLEQTLALVGARQGAVRLLLGRAMAALSVALVARLWLGAKIGLSSWLDTAALAVAATAYVAACGSLARLLPNPWLLDERLGLSARATWWFCAHVGVADTMEEGWPTLKNALDELSATELVLGVSLRRQRLLLLHRAASEACKQQANQLSRLVDWLPLFEMGGVGVPVACALAEPLYLAIHGTLR